MNVAELPFNKFIGIKKSEEAEYLLELADSPDYLNHLGHVHASAQVALAEAASGEYLIRIFKDSINKYVPVVRRLESKFRKPASGKIYSHAKVKDWDLEIFKEELEKKGRSIIKVEVDIVDKNEIATMSAVIEWYVQKVIDNAPN
jgi:acyl-coenzyme A thioesterase PaaI-like protein